MEHLLDHFLDVSVPRQQEDLFPTRTIIQQIIYQEVPRFIQFPCLHQPLQILLTRLNKLRKISLSRLLTHNQQQLLFYLRDNEMPATQSTCLIEITEGPEEVILVLCVIFKFVPAFDTFLIDLVYEADVYLVCV